MKNLNIAFGLYNTNNYYLHTLAALNSIFQRAKGRITAHIIHDNTLSDEERGFFDIITEYYNKDIVFHNIASKAADLPILANMKRYSRGCLYRLFLPKILPEETVVYLDSDTIAAADAGDLFGDINSDMPLMAALDTAPTHRGYFRKYIKAMFADYRGYFNSGVLVFNNPMINAMLEDLPRRVIDILMERTKLSFPDQDALNFIFGVSQNVGYLSGKANFQLESEKRINYNEESLKGKLIHYSWHKPWQLAFPAALPYWRSRKEVKAIVNGQSIYE